MKLLFFFSQQNLLCYTVYGNRLNRVNFNQKVIIFREKTAILSKRSWHALNKLRRTHKILSQVLCFTYNNLLIPTNFRSTEEIKNLFSGTKKIIKGLKLCSQHYANYFSVNKQKNNYPFNECRHCR